jgi:hypothetical protein
MLGFISGCSLCVGFALAIVGGRMSLAEGAVVILSMSAGALLLAVFFAHQQGESR